MATDPREPLGRIVRETWVAWALEQPDVEDHPSWVKPYGELAERDKEVDMRIGSAVAARAVSDAKLEAAAIRKQLVAFSIHMPALRRALAVAITKSEYEAEAGPYRTALRVLGGEQERSDGKEPS